MSSTIIGFDDPSPESFSGVGDAALEPVLAPVPGKPSEGATVRLQLPRAVSSGQED